MCQRNRILAQDKVVSDNALFHNLASAHSKPHKVLICSVTQLHRLNLKIRRSLDLPCHKLPNNSSNKGKHHTKLKSNSKTQTKVSRITTNQLSSDNNLKTDNIKLCFKLWYKLAKMLANKKQPN